MSLTPGQQQAVTERGRDVLVMAGAGSGKTRVLVERYVSLLNDYEIAELVAVTFTDAAASEMRGRVREAVMGRSDLERHRLNLDRAIIGTIHSLCLQLLRENPVEAGIDPLATVLDENVALAEILAASRDAIEAAAAEEEPGTAALLGLGIYQTRQSLPLMMQRRDEVERAFQAMGGDTPVGWEFHTRQKLKIFLEMSFEDLRPVLTVHNEFLRNAQVPDETDALTPHVEEALATVRDLLNGRREDLPVNLHSVAHMEKPGTKGTKAAWLYPPKQVRDSIKVIRESCDALLPFIWNEADTHALRVLESLRELFRSAVGRYEVRKAELGALDFLDLELRAIDMLKRSPSLAAAYRSTFRHVLIDEAQDLNPNQFELLNLLTGTDNERAEGPERFFVGDIKQSIFRFRRSDVRNLNRLREEVETSGGATISLATSFRSHRRLVEATNTVMTDVFGPASNDYEAEMERMEAERSAASDAPPIEIISVDKAYADPKEEGTPNDSRRRRMEAYLVAQRIERLISEEYPIWDRDTAEYRPVQPGDITILLRSMNHVMEYERALEHKSIPYRTATTGHFFTRSEIIDLTNLLEWTAEPANDVALVGLLRSPFFAIDDESLIALKGAGDSWLEALENPPDRVLPQTRPLCIHAARVLTRLREESRSATTEELLEKALSLTNFEASWAPLRGGDQALANIRQFVGMAQELKDKSVSDFVDYIHLLRDELETRAPQAALDAVDAVKILTIHSAKGLEFPVVFLADAGAQHGGSRAPTVLWRADDGISLTLEQDISEIRRGRERPGMYSYLSELERQEDEAESKRLLYVAATRAADLLIITGMEPSGDRETWLGAIAASGKALSESVLAHAPVPVDMTTISGGSQRLPAEDFAVPPADAEQPAGAPLVGRQAVIPIRSSTPATALGHGDSDGFSVRPDPLALARGTLAHAAIEEWFKYGERPDLAELARRQNIRLPDGDMADIVKDVATMLDDFDTSELAATLRDSGVTKHFELPFSWAWDGIAVHGTIDLAYKSAGIWHVVDFKTDRVEKGREGDRASAYLTQLGLYAGAIEAATGQHPRTGLMFLRTGTLHWASPSDIQDSLQLTRSRIDKGTLALMEYDDDVIDFADEPAIV